jgi:hypothetical protein
MSVGGPALLVLASPTGVTSNRLMFWLREMDALRQDSWEAA